MANALTTNPWKLDTANTSTVLSTNRLMPSHLVWVGATAGNDLILKDAAGNTKFVAKAVTASDEYNHLLDDNPNGWDGLIAHTIGSGTVYLYLG